MNKPRSSADKRVSQLPSWLWSNSNALPLVYRRVWEAVKEERPGPGATQGELLVDTKKVFPLLLTSQLPTEVLGYIWSLANQKYAGKLTEQELYVVLALTAVAQTSYPFTNLQVLHLLPGPPTPRLNLSLVYPNLTRVTVQQETAIRTEDLAKKHEIHARSGSKSSPSSGIAPTVLPGLVPDHLHLGETKIDSKVQIPVSSLATIISDGVPESARTIAVNQSKAIAHSSTSLDTNDDFSDFQSAPSVPQVPPGIPVWDTKQGSAIGSRLANHNLGVKKSSEKPKKISSCGSGKAHGPVARSVSTAGSSSASSTSSVPGTGGKESVTAVERPGELFPKCSLKSQANTVILKDTVIRNNDSPKHLVTGRSRESASIDKIEMPLPTRQVAKLVSTTTGKDSESSMQDLMNLQQIEDKYSALRILVEEPSAAPLPEDNTTIRTTLSQSDDFGDFISAEQTESFSTSSIAASNDIFTDFESFKPQSSGPKKTSEAFLSLDDTDDAFGNLQIGASSEAQSLDDKYDINVETGD